MAPEARMHVRARSRFTSAREAGESRFSSADAWQEQGTGHRSCQRDKASTRSQVAVGTAFDAMQVMIVSGWL